MAVYDFSVGVFRSEYPAFEDESRVFKAVYKAVLDAIRPKDEVRQLGQLGNMAAGVEQAEIDRPLVASIKLGTLEGLPGITWRKVGMTSNHHAPYA